MKATKEEMVARLRAFADKIEAGEIEIERRKREITHGQGNFVTDGDDSVFSDCVQSYMGILVSVIDPPTPQEIFEKRVREAFPDGTLGETLATSFGCIVSVSRSGCTIKVRHNPVSSGTVRGWWVYVPQQVSYFAFGKSLEEALEQARDRATSLYAAFL